MACKDTDIGKLEFVPYFQFFKPLLYLSIMDDGYICVMNLKLIYKKVALLEFSIFAIVQLSFTEKNDLDFCLHS